jgi:hypothetical protein
MEFFNDRERAGGRLQGDNSKRFQGALWPIATIASIRCPAAYYRV